jgi:CxxC motif-containing protein (DUF1111 family)
MTPKSRHDRGAIPGKMPHRRIALGVSLAVCVMTLVTAGAPPVAQQGPSEAVTGFTNKTNGFEAQADFDHDREAFDESEEVLPQSDQDGGLGPVYNHTSCVGCHQNSGFVNKVGKTVRGSDAVSGTASQVTEIRAGHNVETSDGVLFQEAPGGSVIQQRAIDPRVQERVPETENIRALRMATNILGSGFVEAIPDLAFVLVRDNQPADVRGVINIVPVVVRPAPARVPDFVFEPRVGRFGWKAQEASLMNFSAGAYVTEIGITSPLQVVENTSLGQSVEFVDPVPDPEDKAVRGHPFGEDVESFTRFMRSTMPPPQAGPKMPDNVERGRRLFATIGCAQCHHPEYTTADKGTRFGDFTVPEALANKTIRPYSDFLLHNIGTGDGIVQVQRSELPPTGLTQTTTDAAGKVKISIDVPRLNALLGGLADPKHPGAQTNDLRRFNLRPAVQVRDPRTVRTAAGVPLAVNETLQHPGMLLTTETAQLIRTAPLWGLRTRPQLLHDGRALTILDAIKEHQKQAETSRKAFDALVPAEKQFVLDFLNFL